MKNKAAVPVIAAVSGLISWGLYAIAERFPTMPLAASVQAAHVDSAWNGLLLIEGAIYAVVMAFLIYCVAAFRARRR